MSEENLFFPVVLPHVEVEILEDDQDTCPVCGHAMDADEAELYREALFIDRASDLARIVNRHRTVVDNGRGLKVRHPTFQMGRHLEERPRPAPATRAKKLFRFGVKLLR